MEMHEAGIKLPENSANMAGKRVVAGAMNGTVEAAVGFVKDVIPDTLKEKQEQSRPVVHNTIVVEDNKNINAVRAELRALKAAPINQPRPVVIQQASA